MIKKLEEYTNQEKIILFDKIYEQTLEEWNDSMGDPDEHDEHYFWEGIMEDVLGDKIWDR